MEKNLKCCYGFSSNVPNTKKHIFMMDWDYISYYSMLDDIKRIQAFYMLSDVYIFRSGNGFNAVSLDLIDLKTIYEIGIESIYTDRDFVVYGYDRGYYVLRLGPDKILERVLKNNDSFVHKYKKSNGHAELLETIYNIKINRDDNFINNSKCDIIQYPSKKDGYHEVKK